MPSGCMITDGFVCWYMEIKSVYCNPTMINVDKFNCSHVYRKVRIDKGASQCDQGWRFNASRVRLHYQVTGKISSVRKPELACHSNRVEVGEFLNNFEKDALAFQLKDCIIRADFHRRLAFKAQRAFF